MKKRVISWLLCLALCLSMLPMAALAEDVQAPEGPAPSMNEPQPEPRAKENETPAPEPEEQPEQEEPEQEQKEPSRKKPEAEVQPELMTVGNLFIPLTAFSISEITVEQDSNTIAEGATALAGEETFVYAKIVGVTAGELQTSHATLEMTIDGVSTGNGGYFNANTAYWTFTPSAGTHTIKCSITYNAETVSLERTVEFNACSHPSCNDRGKCTQCGATLVAEINSATYYETLSEALDAAQTEANSGCTVTLISNSSLTTDYTVTQGNFTIDLHKYEQGTGTIYVSGTADVTVKNESAGQFEGNFCWSGADAKLTLAEGSAYAKLSVAVTGKTVADLLPGGCGYQVSGNWVSESGLNQTTIQSVLVKKAPFTVDDFSVNSSSYINVPFQISASVRSSNFPNGHIDFDYCLYIDDILKKTGKQNSYSRLYMDCTLEDGSQHTAKLVVSYNGYSVTKTLVLQAVACPHTTIVQTTGKCNVCKLQMAASVSPEALVIRRTLTMKHLMLR